MKVVLPISPVFTIGASGLGTLNFTTNGLVGSTFDIRRLFAVINQTKNTLIYAETVAGLGYTAWSSSTKVLNLQLDTSSGGYSSSDSLQAIYDDPNATVSISGNVEITNDAGNAIPVSAASLPLPSGAATETTLSAIKSLFLNNAIAFPLSSAFSAYAVNIPSSTISIGSFVCELVGTWTGAIFIDATMDGTNWINVPFVNLNTGTTVATLAGGSGFLIGLPVAGYSQIRFRGSAFSTTGTMVYGSFTEKIIQNSSSTAASVSVSNFPATQAISGNVGVTGSVEITNDVGNSIPVSLASSGIKVTPSTYSLSITPSSIIYTTGFLIGVTFTVENSDTGYGPEPSYVKFYFDRSTAPVVGTATPDLTLCLSDGIRVLDSYTLPAPVLITGINNAYVAVTRNRANTDATPVTSSILLTTYTRNN